MQVTIKVPEELAAQARARGLSLEDYVEALLATQVNEVGVQSQAPRTPDEIRSWLESLAQFSAKIPPLPEVISREWLYQDHD